MNKYKDLKKVLIAPLAILVVASAAFVIQNFSRPEIVPIKTEPSAMHYSSFSSLDFFENAFQAAQKIPVQPKAENIKAIIVNHHLLAPHFIAQAINTIATDQPITVIIISPNHFLVGRGQITTSSYAWETPYGELRPNLELIDELKKASRINVEEPPFEKEFGISNIVAYVKKAAPNARVLPLIVKERLTEKSAEAFGRSLADSLPEDAVVIASIDFYHGFSTDEAVSEDKKSISVLESLNSGNIKQINVDSHATLEILFEYLKQKNVANFSLLQNSNSAAFAPTTKDTEIVSYITGFFY